MFIHSRIPKNVEEYIQNYSFKSSTIRKVDNMKNTTQLHPRDELFESIEYGTFDVSDNTVDELIQKLVWINDEIYHSTMSEDYKYIRKLTLLQMDLIYTLQDKYEMGL